MKCWRGMIKNEVLKRDEVFKIAKRMAKTNQNIGEHYITIDDAVLVVCDEYQKIDLKS